MNKKKNNKSNRNLLKRFVWILLFFISPSLFSGTGTNCRAQDADYKAYTLFLYNFMKYVEWPEHTGDFIIGVVGNSPIEKELITLSENKKAKGKKIVVKVINTAEEAETCSMIYLPSGKSSMLKQIMEKVKGKPILVVAEREGLAQKGAGISFAVDDDDALKFDINKSSLESHSLKIANILMQLGILVG